MKIPVCNISNRGALASLLVVGCLMFAPKASASDDCPVGEGSAAPTVVRVGLFSPSLPLIAAAAKGFFGRHGVAVAMTVESSSSQQFLDLRDDKVDMLLTAPDDVTHYRLNAHNPAGGTLDLTMILGTTGSLDMTLVTRPEIRTVEDLRGKRLAVDSPDSGYANVLYKIMRNHGLERGRDYYVIPIGQTQVRLGALLGGNVDGTLLLAGLEKVAQFRGFNLLDNSATVADPYLASAFAAKNSWLSTHENGVIGFLKGYLEAVRWSLDPANAAEAVALLQQPNVPVAITQIFYQTQLTPGVGIIPDGRIHPEEMRKILALRSEFHGFEQPTNIYLLATPFSGLYDLSYLRKTYYCEE